MNKEEVKKFGDSKETLNYDIRREVAIAEARAKGLIVKYPKENELLLDIDTEENLNLFEQRISHLMDWFDCDFEIKPSQSGPPHYHVYVEFFNMKFSNIERLFLQLFLCSDPTREILSYLRILNGEVHPTLLLEKPDEK